MKRAYQVVERKNSQALTEFLAGEGSALLPFVELIQQTELAVDELVVAAGRSAIEAVLTLSARQIAGPKHPGRRILRPGAGSELRPSAADHLSEAADRGEQGPPSGAGNEAIGWP